MSESSKRDSKFLSLSFILKCLSKASVITNRLPNRYFPKTDLGAPVQFSANERRKYSKKKRKSWNLWTSLWIRTEKNPPTFRGDQQSSFKNRFSLARLQEWNLWLEMIDTDNKHPTLSRDKCSLKEGFDLSAHLGTLRFWSFCGWKRTRSHKLVSSALQMHFTVHLKSPVWTHLKVKVHRIPFNTCLQDYELFVACFRHGRSGYRQSGRWHKFAHP